MLRSRRSSVSASLRSRSGVPVVALAAATLAGCGSQATTTPIFHPLRPPTPRPPHHVASRAHPKPKLGVTQRVAAGGTTLSVTVHAILDPLRGSGAALLPGTRAVGVVAEIRNDGSGSYDSSSTGDFSIVPSSGPAQPVFARSGSCATPLRDWDNAISPGGDQSGCVAFMLASAARVTAIRFSPHAAARGRATWLASR
jgi:hypothetical protein